MNSNGNKKQPTTVPKGNTIHNERPIPVSGSRYFLHAGLKARFQQSSSSHKRRELHHHSDDDGDDPKLSRPAKTQKRSDDNEMEQSPESESATTISKKPAGKNGGKEKSQMASSHLNTSSRGTLLTPSKEANAEHVFW